MGCSLDRKTQALKIFSTPRAGAISAPSGILSAIRAI